MPATAAQAILNSPAFIQMPAVELFVEHELRDPNGKVVRKVGPDELQKIAQKAMQRYQASGDLAPFGPGHTYDDQYEMGPDGRPKLVRKFPETDQPPIWGYFGPNWVMQRRPGDGKYAVYATPFVRSEIEYTENGVPKKVHGPEVFREFPRRSPEYYSGLDFIDYVALLRRTPKLDMGLSTYARTEPEKAYYVMGSDGASLLAGVAAGFSTKIRYAMGVDDLMALPTTTPARYEPDPMPPPTAPPTDKGAVGPPQSQPVEAEADRYAAECVGKGLGMHPDRAKALMHHLYSMHAPALGMSGDMNAPMTSAPPAPPATPAADKGAMAMPSPTNAMPAPSSPHLPAPSPHHQPERHAMNQTDPERYAMQQTIARLEQEVKAERDARMATEGRAREQYRRGILEGMRDNEGVRIDVDEHLKYSAGFPDQLFISHVELLRKSADRAPVGGPRVFDPWQADPAKAPQRHQAPESPQRMTEEQREAWSQPRLDYMRFLGLSGPDAFDQACERYEKEVVNGRKVG